MDREADLGIYAQDRWTIHRLTVNYGLRFDYYNSYVPAQQVPATPWGWLPERNFAPVKGVPEWTDLNPRVGASYDLFGDGRTAVKGSIGRYVGVLGTDLANANNPINTSVNSVLRTWSDTNRNYLPDCDLGNFGGNGECGPINDRNFGQANPNATRYADDLIRGFHKRDYFWDMTAELQHELRAGISVQGGYYRNWTDQYSPLGGVFYGGGVTDNLAVGPGDFDPFCITAPTDSRLPGGGGYQVCGMFDVNPTKFGQVNNLVRRASDFGKRSRVSDFFSVKIDSRLGAGTVLGASVDTGRTVEDNCYVVDAPGLYNYSSAVFGISIPPNVATTINGKRTAVPSPRCRSNGRRPEAARAGVSQSADKRVDVLLADIAMPGEDGYAFIRKVRALTAPHKASIPAAALTASAREDQREAACAAGFQLHIAKPVEPAQLVWSVAKLMRAHPRAASV